jgi:hypothetical protein
MGWVMRSSRSGYPGRGIFERLLLGSLAAMQGEPEQRPQGVHLLQQPFALQWGKCGEGDGASGIQGASQRKVS